VGSSEFVGYCSYTKAIEHLGDRWSLLIVRELGTFGPQGFNDLALGLPGRISRSVLADRLRRLETLGLVSHRDGQDPHPAYHLTSVGQGLMRTLGSLRAWADTWLPDDPDMLERDPDILLGWLARRADPDRAPGRPVVLHAVQHVLHPPVLLPAWPNAMMIATTGMVGQIVPLNQPSPSSLNSRFDAVGSGGTCAGPRIIKVSVHQTRKIATMTVVTCMIRSALPLDS